MPSAALALPKKPTTLQGAIDEFIKLYQWCKIPEEADGHCGMVSSAFVNYLIDDLGLKKPRPRVMGYRARNAWLHPLKPNLLSNERTDKMLRSGRRRGVGEWNGHAVVAIGRVRIDWTARQFDPNAPVPLIWTVKS